MKERPILFNGEMVRAVLDGRKTQTRRVVKQNPFAEKMIYDLAIGWRFSGGPNMAVSPYGKPGDRLWVRESTHSFDPSDDYPVTLSRYSADNSPVLYSLCEDEEYNGTEAHWWYSKDSCPSIHMPRWASRILLEVVSVRVERVQEISEEDAFAEGISDESDAYYEYEKYQNTEVASPLDAAVSCFRDLWDSINAKRGYGWDANPWVWVVEFKKVEG